MAVNVDGRRCPANHRCPSVRVCHTGALTQKGHEVPEVVKELCTNCGKCIRFCPYRVFSMEGGK